MIDKIRFTGIDSEAEFNSPLLDPLLRTMAYAVVGMSWHRWGVSLWVTSVYREEDTNSVHGHWRGIDLDEDAILTSENKREMAQFINANFQYDPNRPDYQVAIVHSVPGRGGDHIHLQVHHNTKVRRA